MLDCKSVAQSPSEIYQDTNRVYDFHLLSSLWFPMATFTSLQATEVLA